MPAPLDVNTVFERLVDFPTDRYVYIGSMMRGVALGTGAFVVTVIYWKKFYSRYLMWLGSVMATLVTLSTWGRGALLTNSKANIWDMLLPLFMGIIEFCLFTMLLPRDDNPDERSEEYKRRLCGNWYLMLSVHSLLACILVHNRIVQTDVIHDFHPALREIGSTMMKWMTIDRSGAFIGSLLFFVLAILIKWILPHVKNKNIRYVSKPALSLYKIVPVFPLLATVNYFFVVLDSENQRREIDKAVTIKHQELERKGKVDKLRKERILRSVR